MGLVYRINFPCGHFYIGHTGRLLKYRLFYHVSCPVNKRMKSLLKINKITVEDLISFTKVIYKGRNSGYKEECQIWENQCYLMLNKIVKFPYEISLEEFQRRKRVKFLDDSFAKMKAKLEERRK